LDSGIGALEKHRGFKGEREGGKAGRAFEGKSARCVEKNVLAAEQVNPRFLGFSRLRQDEGTLIREKGQKNLAGQKRSGEIREHHHSFWGRGRGENHFGEKGNRKGGFLFRRLHVPGFYFLEAYPRETMSILRAAKKSKNSGQRRGRAKPFLLPSDGA